jgi:hypothetical protein
VAKHTYKSWFDAVQKYVWNEEKTPYGIPVSKLNRNQADSEFFAFALFLGVLFGVVGVVSLTPLAPHGRSPGVGLYAFSILFSAVAVGLTKNVIAVGYCGLSPLVALAYFFVWGFPAGMASVDQILFIGVAILFFRYSWRVVKISKIYEGLPTVPKKGRYG